MKRFIAACAIASLAFTGASLYAADPVQRAAPGAAPEPGGTNDPASAEKKHESIKDGVKAGGAAAGATSGRENDPCSAEHAAGATGGNVKCDPERAGQQPGRANDPASAQPKQ
jgi:hypothetical protein